MPLRVLVISARMGAGHEGASREIARRLEAEGHRADVVDFLDAFPRPLSRLWKWFYFFQLRRFPESYESSYQLFYRHPRLWSPFVRFERSLSGRRTLRWIRDLEPDVIVSTYSFATLVVGQLKAEGRVHTPAVNFLTDFGVHPRCVHPSVELNLAVHEVSAEAARRWISTPVVATGPAVAPEFTADTARRDDMRRQLGIAPAMPMVLVVSGSWGIGHSIETTVAALVGAGQFAVVTVCANDTDLRSRLEARGHGIAIGWTDQMPALMAAADVVVENAGGLTSLEAFASTVPVVSYRPIPGHGRDNVANMVRAGVTTAPTDEAALVAVVTELASDSARRRAQVAAATAMFAEDPTRRIVDLAQRRPEPSRPQNWMLHSES